MREPSDETAFDDDLIEFALAAGFGPQLRTPAAPHRTDGGGDAAPQEIRFGDYRIVRELGRGGMGIVYEAVEVTLGRKVALKVLPYHGLSSSSHLARFQREAQAASQLHHTNIVTVYGVGEHNGAPFYAMQFIAGESLDKVLAKLRGSPSPGEDRRESAAPAAPAAPPANGAKLLGATDPDYYRSVARLGFQVADALAYAHRHGVLHRDIKPSNLLLDSAGTVWIADFGLAKEEGAEGLTQAGDILGTIQYMAPERFQGRSLPQGDVYSLGLTLYELLTLRPGFAPAARETLIEQVLHDSPPPPRSISHRVPRDLERIVLKAVSKFPEDRYPSAEAMADDLRRFLDDRPVQARPATAVERAWRWSRRNPLVAALLVSVIGLLASLAIGSLVAAARLRSAERVRAAELYRSYITQARFGRVTAAPGQGLGGLDAIRRATELVGIGSLTAEQALELRNEAIACLAVPDLRLALERDSGAEYDFGGHGFDTRLERYTYLDTKGRLVLRRTATNELLHQFPPPPEPTRYWYSHAWISPGDRWLSVHYAALQGPDLCRVWDLEDRSMVFEARGGEMTFGPDGETLALGLEDGAIGVFRLPEGRGVLRIGRDPVLPRLRFDRAGARLACAAGKKLSVFEVTSSGELCSFTHEAELQSLAWSREGRWLAAGCADSRIYVYNAPARVLHAVLEGHENAVIGVDFSPTEDLLVSSGWDGMLRMWDPWIGRLLLVASGQAVGFSSDGGRLGFLRENRTFGIWDVESGSAMRMLGPTWEGSTSPWSAQPEVREVDFSPDGRWLASASDDGVRLWDTATRREAAHLAVGFVESVRFEPQRGGLMTFGEIGLLRWPFAVQPDGGSWALGPPEALDLAGRFNWQRLCLDGGGRYLAYTDNLLSQAVLIDRERPEQNAVLDGQPRIVSIALSPDGRWAAATGWKDTHLTVWDRASGRVAVRLSPRSATTLDGVASTAFSPDNQWLVAGWNRGYASWRLGTWEPGLEVARTGSDPGRSPLAFDRGGSVLALARDPRSVLLVEFPSGRELATFAAPHPRIISWLAFSPGGEFLAVASEERALQLWDLRAVRRELAARHLDWDPPAPGALLSAEARRPAEIAVVGAEDAGRQFRQHHLGRLNAKLDDSSAELLGSEARTRAEVRRRLKDPVVDLVLRGVRARLRERSLPEAEQRAWEEYSARVEALCVQLDLDLAPPGAPTNLGPEGGAVVGDSPLVLESSPFAHADARAAHGWSRWQVRAEGWNLEHRPVLDCVRRDALTSLSLPRGLLVPGTTYFWRVAHAGADGQLSDFSAETPFVTGALRLRPVRLDLSAVFNRDVVADPGDAENDEFDPGPPPPLFIADGFDGQRADNVEARGLPRDRVAGVHLLGDYGVPNSLQLRRGDPGPLRIEAPRRRCAAVRFLVSEGWGNSQVPVAFEYAGGSREEFALPCRNWCDDLPRVRVGPPLAETAAVLKGLCHLRGGGLQCAPRGCLFEVLIPANEDLELTAIVLDPERGEFDREVTRFNLFAVTCMALD